MEIKLFHGASRQENGCFASYSKNEREKIKNVLMQLYDVEKNSTVKIAKQLGVSPQTIHYWLRETNIPIRTLSESATLRIYKQLKKGFEGLSPAKAYILGVLCGDGYVSGSEVGLHVCDKDFVVKFAKSISIVYGYFPHISTIPADITYFPNTGRWHRVKKSYKARIRSKEIARDLMSYGHFVRYEASRCVWRIPLGIVDATETIKGAFLRGFFDSEGSVATNARAIEVINTCVTGLREVKQLLVTIGIETNILPRANEMFDLTIHGKRNFRKVQKNINFTIKRKRKKLSIIAGD